MRRYYNWNLHVAFFAFLLIQLSVRASRIRWHFRFPVSRTPPTSIHDHFDPCMTISVLGPKWSSTSVHDHFGTWPFRFNMKISWPFRSKIRSVRDHFGPLPDRSMTSSVFSLCVKRTIGHSCQVAMFMIGVKCQPLSIPLATLTPASNVQISGGRLPLTLTNVQNTECVYC